MTKLSLLLVTGTALALATACASGAPATPNEFKVVTKAPLTVPPEYNLRPPQAGSSLPAEVNPELAGTSTAFGTSLGNDASASERALVKAAGAQATNPVIRAQVDYEETKTLRKSKSAVDKVLFWRKTGQGDAPIEEGPVQDNATGNEPVTIERGNGKSRLKLPGT
jgi:hypothetical protein